MDTANHVPGVDFQANISILSNDNKGLIFFASHE